MIYHRDVAQLVAHYVRDVGVGRSSRLIPTKVGKCKISLFDFFVYQFVEIGISYITSNPQLSPSTSFPACTHPLITEFALRIVSELQVRSVG